MIFLLDVNVLLAMQYEGHEHHTRVMDWKAQLVVDQESSAVEFATCPITELGFVRVASGKAGYAPSVATARDNLQKLRREYEMTFIPDDRPAHDFPAWVRKSDQTTDGYLLELAKSHGGYLATLDRFIPESVLIAEVSGGPIRIREEPAIADWAAHLSHLADHRTGSPGMVIR